MRSAWLLLIGVLAAASPAQETIRKEIDVAYAPVESVRPVLERVLSPRGKFVMLPSKGAVLVIDLPQQVLAAEAALASADLPVPEVAVDFQFVTGLPRQTSITAAQEVPFPVAFAPPTIFVGANGRVAAVVPATPTKFVRRNIGVTSESTATMNPDGSVTLDVKSESSAFAGFVHYGSGVFLPGQVGSVSVNDRVGEPGFFGPWINTGGVSLPIISTTRITTTLVVRPRIESGIVHLDLMPRIEVEVPGTEPKTESIDLKEFQTVLSAKAGEVGRVRGFPGADDAFHRHFFGAEKEQEGGAAIVARPVLRVIAPED